MPIYHADLDHDHGRQALRLLESTPQDVNRGSEDGVQPDFHGHSLPDETLGQRNQDDTFVSSREQLIERLKRGESPTWRPSAVSTLLPSAQIIPFKTDSISFSSEDPTLSNGLSIERPRSALHSGDFTHHQSRSASHSRNPEEELREKNKASWITTSPPRQSTPFDFTARNPPWSPPPFGSLSSSLSSSFVYHPPTSPLVQSESNEELEPSSSGPTTGLHRRHTLYSSRTTPRLNRPGSLPYQAHQPRRSLTSTPNFLQSRTPPRGGTARRPSFGSDSTHHASMVGSYEESILRGRMSTTPSKPIDFIAQIGVLGLGNCKPSLKCPSHVSLPFPAVYYSYSSAAHGRSRSDDGPSPYVGQIDLENGLPNYSDESRARKKVHSRKISSVNTTDANTAATTTTTTATTSNQVPEELRQPRPKRRRSTTSPRAPPGGSYRIPEKGQLQIIIKNQNKTAVKLFLIPYDLSGMDPGTKTFIRQRSYSAGPIIDGAAPTPLDRPILRYLIHLHICSPSKGRFFLYKSIRVVFANRVPDDKEKLRNDTTGPEPRFSPYKTTRVMNPPPTPGAIVSLNHNDKAGTTTTAAARRRSACLPDRPRDFDSTMDDEDNISSMTSTPPPSSLQTSATTTTTQESSQTKYTKLNKGDVGYGGHIFPQHCSYSSSSSLPADSPSPTEGLLSQRLKSLGVEHGGSADS